MTDLFVVVASLFCCIRNDFDLFVVVVSLFCCIRNDCVLFVVVASLCFFPVVLHLALCLFFYHFI